VPPADAAIRRVAVHTAHTIPDRPPIRLHIDEEVQVGERDDEWPAFVFVTTSTGSGWMPARYLNHRGSGRAVVRTPYDTTELATHPGETLDVLAEDHESGWLWCQAGNGAQGWVPTRTVNPAS
jgi:hypothetical protein